MKEIKAIIQPPKLNMVLDTLHHIPGVSGVMSSEVRCTGAACGNGNPDINTKIELVVPDELVEQVLEAIRSRLHRARGRRLHLRHRRAAHRPYLFGGAR